MKLSVIDTLTHALTSIKNHIGFYVALIVLYLSAQGLLMALVQWFEEPGFLMVLLYKVLSLALDVKLAVTVHRSVLMHEVGVWKRVFWWNRCESEFLVLTFVLGLFFVVSGFILGLVVSWVFGGWLEAFTETTQHMLMTFGFSVYTWLIFTRVSLVFPTLAVNQNLCLEDSVHLSGRYFIPMLCLLSLVPMVSLLVVFFANFETNYLTLLIAWMLVGMLLVLNIAILSHVYQQLVSSKETEFSL